LQIQPSKFAKCPTVDHEIAERNPTVHGSLKAHATIASQCRKKKTGTHPCRNSLQFVSLIQYRTQNHFFLLKQNRAAAKSPSLLPSVCLVFIAKKTETQLSKRKTLTPSLFIRPAGKKKKVSLSSSLKFSVFLPVWVRVSANKYKTRGEELKKETKRTKKKRQTRELCVIG
jgi:hypothetical protein